MIAWDQIIFWCFSALLLASATWVIMARHPVHSVLFLVLSFLAGASLWMLAEAEFLSLVLVFVYVGAVMTLFLFVVMMLPLQERQKLQCKKGYWPSVIVLFSMLLGFLIGMIQKSLVHPIQMVQHNQNYSNVQALGQVLYTHYLLSFEVVAVILLLAIVATIGLTFRGRRLGTRSQRISQQVRATKAGRLHLVDLKRS